MLIGRIASAWVIAFALLSAHVVAAGGPRAQGGESTKARLLDVPFVEQSEALCGGAAAAMVFRYWGKTPVYAEDFASLVVESAEGIRLGDLARAVEERGWRALPFAGTASGVQLHLSEGRPVIALIEDRPGRYHYVVVVAWATGQIVFHDPARGAFRVVDVDKFQRVWAVTGHTALLILPQSEPTAPASASSEPRGTASDACAEPVEEAIRIARTGDLDASEKLLAFVREACPSQSGASRELAGVRFLQKRWPEAAALAEEAVKREPSDLHSWQLLATARFLQGDADGALTAWNRRAEPHVDLARVEGLDRIHHQVVSGMLNLPPQTLLTASELQRAKRRIADLPALQTSRVSYSPRASGLATVDVAVLERSLLPKTWPSFAAVGLHAATAREVRVDVASPTGNGELWTATWRWWANRPRVSVAVATPRLGRWTGLWRLDGAWERQTYRVVSSSALDETSSDDALITSERRRGAVTFGDWRSGDFRWEVSGALDNWDRNRRHVSASVALERRLARDTVAVRVDSTAWPGMGGARGFGSGGVTSAWRSSPEGSASWTVQAGLQAASSGAPFDLWPAADTGHARMPLLRAHPLLEDGAIRASALGRVLAHSTVEFQKKLATTPFAQLRWAAFADAAKQGTTPTAATLPFQLDLGVGLRAELPGASGMLRVDIARGIRDGGVAVSAAWQPTWPGW